VTLIYRYDFTFCPLPHLFLVVLGFELRAPHLLGW
jgi:hypothetical protein